MRKVLLSLVFFICSIPLLSQKNLSENALLWRISGNGLSRPSYLFGTMHLADRKIFYLSDSLYRALEQAEGFVAELDMHRLGMEMVNHLISEEERKTATEPVKVKDVVPPELWLHYKDRLQLKFLKPAEKITIDDLEDVESEMSSLYLKGEMATFLDAHLFGIARKMGKWIGGLEEFQDQVEYLNTEDIEEKIQVALYDNEYYKSGLDWMIRIYTNQLLDTLDALTYREGKSGKKDIIMIKRNLKMVRGMDSLALLRSTFFAVGAAHLPGDSGVINLLRSKGYTLTPVHSAKKINPDKYVPKVKDINWVGVDIKDSAYRLEMPGIAQPFQMFESWGLEMKAYFDISYQKLYMTLILDLPKEKSSMGKDSLYKQFARRFSSQGKDLKEKSIIINGTEGKEFIGQSSGSEMRIQIFLPSMERVILNVVSAYSKKTLNDGDAKRFFQSFVYNKNFKRSVAPETPWIRYSPAGQYFSVDLPGKPIEKKDVNSNEGKILYNNSYVDLTTQVYYGIVNTCVKANMYDKIDSNFVSDFIATMRRSFDEFQVSDSISIPMGAYPAVRMRVSGKVKGDLIEGSYQLIARGNRNYYVYTVYAPSERNKKSTERFLNSFQLEEYRYPTFQKRIDSSGNFSVSTPFSFNSLDSEDFSSVLGQKRMVSYDSIMSTTIFLDRTSVPGWLEIGDDTAFLKKLSKSFLSSGDSIIEYKFHYKDGIPTVEFAIRSGISLLVRKSRMMLNGNEILELYTYVLPLDYEEHFKDLFESFVVTKKLPRGAVKESYIVQLYDALNQGDSTVAAKVKLWWPFMTFKNEDIPVLQKLLIKLHNDFDSSFFNNLNVTISDKLMELDTNHSTVTFIKNEYDNIKQGDEFVKPLLISHLSKIKTRESYNLVKDILINRKPAIDREIFIGHSFYDSVQLSVILFPEIMKLADDPFMKSLVVPLTVLMLDSQMISREHIKIYSRGFLKSAKELAEVSEEYAGDNQYDYYNYIKILQVINTPEAKSLLQKFSRFDNHFIRFHTLIAMLKNNQPVDSKTIFTMASSNEYRSELYDELKKIGKTSLIPREYLSQAELGKSEIFKIAQYDELVASWIEYKKEKLINYKGKQQRIFIYQVSLGGPESYLGFAGPYPLNPKDYSSDHSLTGFYLEEEYDPAKTEQHFSIYLKHREETND